MSIPERHDVFVVEPHAVENITQVLNKCQADEECNAVTIGIERSGHSLWNKTHLRALRSVGQATVGRCGGPQRSIGAAELVRDRGASQELDGAGACESPEVGLAEVGIAHVDGVEEVADDRKALGNNQ